MSSTDPKSLQEEADALLRHLRELHEKVEAQRERLDELVKRTAEIEARFQQGRETANGLKAPRPGSLPA